MSRKTASVERDDTEHKRPYELTDQEVFQLLRAFVRDKTQVPNADCVTLCRWAAQQKYGAFLLIGILHGGLVPEVKDGAVSVRAA